MRVRCNACGRRRKSGHEKRVVDLYAIKIINVCFATGREQYL